ncbi:MAG: type II secretion protein F [Colwellia sp.]|nr:MAG: type II secretion protein F [Colwellia sp.]
MPLFSYTVLTAAGNELTGKQQAADINAATQALRERSLRVLAIKPARGQDGFGGQENFSDWLASQRSVSPSALIFFFRQMAFMLRAGLAVTESLTLTNTQISSARLRLTSKLMLKDIESGQTLSAAMKTYPSVFPDMAVNLMVAGENTGDLDVIMERLATHLEKKSALRAQMINAMIYPVIVVIAALGVAAFMMLKIIPKFADFLLGQGKKLPPSTQALINTSDYIQQNGIWIITVVIVFIVLLLLTYQTKRGRLIIDYLSLRIPVIGPMLTTASMGQVTWALSTLLASGVTVYQSLKITGKLLTNRVFSDKMQHAAKKVLTGKDMASSLQHPRIPVLVTQMIAVGERTGSLDKILQEMGIYYEQRLDIAIKRMTALIEPVMILVIGAMVGFVYYAFFQALFSLVGG